MIDRYLVIYRAYNPDLCPPLFGKEEKQKGYGALYFTQNQIIMLAEEKYKRIKHAERLVKPRDLLDYPKHLLSDVYDTTDKRFTKAVTFLNLKNYGSFEAYRFGKAKGDEIVNVEVDNFLKRVKELNIDYNYVALELIPRLYNEDPSKNWETRREIFFKDI